MLRAVQQRPMKPRSGSASLAATSWFTWSKRVKWWKAWGEASRIAFTGRPYRREHHRWELTLVYAPWLYPPMPARQESHIFTDMV